MASDVKATNFVAASSPGTAVNHRARVRSINYVSAASAGSIVLKNGSTGDTLLTVVTPAGIGGHDVVIPDQGVLFADEVYCTLTNVTSVTIFHS
jgi:hypothetical protein